MNKKEFRELKEMTKELYIVPGIGDAGDLSFGKKK